MADGPYNEVAHSLLSSIAIRIMSSRNSGGSEPKLNFFFDVNTLLPICNETEDESPWMALLMPIPWCQDVPDPVAYLG
jgi:hypothetical protein